MTHERYAIHVTDALEHLTSMDDGSVDVIVTSPPYNLTGLRGRKLHPLKPNSKWRVWKNSDIAYGDNNDDLPEEVYRRQQIAIINRCMRALKPTGSLFYNHKVRFAGRAAHHPMEWICDSDAILHQEIIWDRGCSPMMQKYILYPFTERIYWLVPGKPAVFKDRCRFRSDIWRIIPRTHTDHPAPFPLELAENCLLLTAPENSLICDPYAGSGTTAVAALKHGHRFTGSEISQEYRNAAMDRIESFLRHRDSTLLTVFGG